MVLTSFGRVRRMTERAAQRLPEPVDVLELDVNQPEDLEALTDVAARALGRRRRGPARDRLRPRGCARRAVHDRPGRERDRRRFRPARSRSRRSAAALAPLMPSAAAASSGWTSTPPWPGRSTTGWASPRRRWSRSRAIWPATSGPQGIRVNLVSAGPLGTVAARGIPGFEQLADAVAGPGAARLGHRRSRGRWPARSASCCPTTRAGDQRRDRPRRRRLSRRRRTRSADALTRPPA